LAVIRPALEPKIECGIGLNETTISEIRSLSRLPVLR
jgi:hypothetical protein